MNNGQLSHLPPADKTPIMLEALEPRLLLSGNPNLWPLVLPDSNVASLPVMQPSVVTAGGQRLLLSYFNSGNGGTLGSPVTVTYDPRTDQLISNKPGWWIINYPLDQIIGLPNIGSPASVNNPTGLSDSQIQNLVAADLFGPGQTASDVRNWYILTPVDAAHPLAAEPNAPTGPAPITPTDLSNCYVLVVDNDTSHTVARTDPWVASRIAAGQNVIVDATVYRTITDAMNRVYSDPYYNSTTNTVTMKTVILVAPGTYREFVYDNRASGTPTCPLIFEGVPDANGNMPTISGATVFANNSWTSENVLGDVNVSGNSIYRANIPLTTGDWGGTPQQRIGPVAANNQTLVQRSNPAFLNPGEDAFNYGSTQFLNMYGMTQNSGLSAVPATGQTATAVSADANGYLNFSAFGGTTNQVVWIDTWVWVPPHTGCGYLGTGQETGADNYTYGPFRAAPMTDEPVDDQANPYRLWINGTAVGQIYNSDDDYEQDLTHPDARAFNPFSTAANPIEDTWNSLTLNIGWNHLVFQFDTSVAVRYGPAGSDTAQSINPYYSETPYWQQALDFKFTFDSNTFDGGGVICQAAAPTGAELTTGPTGTPTSYISAYEVLGTFAATTADNGVYVRLTAAQSANYNPNSVTTELANRDCAFTTEWQNQTGNYVEVRGFNARFDVIDGLGIGDVIEGNYITDSVGGINTNECSVEQNLNFTYAAGGNYINITNGSTSNLAAGDAVSYVGSVGDANYPAPLLNAHTYFIGGNPTGTNNWELFASAADALAGTNPIALSDASGSGTLTIARGGTANAPAIVSNNWMVNVGGGSSCNPCTFFDGVNENLQIENGSEVLDVAGHERTIIEYNYIANFNPMGMWFGWDIAGLGKTFGAVQNVYAYNVFDGGAGLAIWLDTDNFDNILDGNLFLNMHASAINIEASPGPNLIANNIIIPAADDNGGDIASWSSNRDWVVNNTLDGGEGFYAAANMNTGENAERQSPWNTDPAPANGAPVWYDQIDAQQAYVNNLFLNIATAMSADTNSSTPDVAVGNYTDNAADVTVSPFYQSGQDAAADYLPDSYMALADPAGGDYRLTASSALNNLGASDVMAWTNFENGANTYTDVTDMVTTDFYGLLRFSSDGNSVGATRAAHTYTSTTLEVEYADGTMQRLANWHSVAARWKFDETNGTTAADSSGNGLTATVQGNAAWGSGRIGGDLSLNGVSQDATVPDNNAFDFSSTSAFTISAWVQLSGTISSNSTYYPIISHGSGGSSWELSLRGNGAAIYNGVYLRVDGLTLEPTLDESSVFNDHAWHLVTATRDAAGNGALYIDGVLVGTATGLNLDTTNTSELDIGRCGAGYFPGALDDVRIYGRALSSVEVAALRDVPAVSVAATDSQASELGDTGTFTVTRTAGSTALPLIVYYTTGGTAANGVDYAPLSGNVTIPAGAASATITVAPTDSAFGNDETVVVNLLANDDASALYTLTGTTSGTVTLLSATNQIARWKLDETGGTTAANSGGAAGLNGTLWGSPTWNANGYLEGGLTLAAASQQYVSVQDNSALDFTAGAPFTISAWVNPANFVAGSVYPILSHGSGYELSLSGGATNKGLSFTVGGATLNPTADQTALLDDGNWHLVTATLSAGGLATLYIDGVSVGTASGMSPGTTDTGTLYIGRDGANYFNGSVDDVRMYGRALSTAEIAALHNATVVSIAATDNQAAELGNTGTFTVTRTGPTTNALTVYYTVSGSNTINGTSYVRLPGTVTIPAGQSSATITVTPIDSMIGSGGTVVLTLAADPNSQYDLSRPLGSATVNLNSATDLLADWKFDAGSGTTAANSGSGGGLTGTLVNGPTWGSGQINGGLTLNGTNQYVDVPANSAMNGELSFGTGGFTISAWVQLAPSDNLTNVSYPILSIGDPNSSNLTLSLANEGNYEWTLGLDFVVQGASGYLAYVCPLPDVGPIFRDHQWHMVTITRDDNNMVSLYLDGSPIMINLGGGQGRVPSIKLGSPVLNLSNGNHDLLIGRDAAGANYFRGSLDNVEIYNRGLSAGEVRLLADATAASLSTTNAGAAEAGQVPGTFTVSRTGGPSEKGPLTVYYTLGGTAANTLDYSTLSGSVVIPAGQSSAVITVTPVDDDLIQGPQTVTLTLSNFSTYMIGAQSSTPVTIADDTTDVAPTNLTATATDTNRMNLTWTNHCANATDFLIDRATDGNFTTFTTIDTHSVIPSYTDSGLTDGTAYYYRVRASNGANSSANSAPAGATACAMQNPTVISLTPNLRMIADANTGKGTFWLTAVYSETMNTAVTPTITFTPGASGALTFDPGLSGWSNSTTYVARYDVADADTALPSVNARVSGAQDIAGDVQSDSGDGTFGIKTDLNMGRYPTAVAAADVNGDGRPDLVVSNVLAGTITVAFGNGDGTFKAPATYTPACSYPDAVVVSDFNGDGKPDIAVAGDYGVSIFMNNGDGTFTAGTTFATIALPWSIVAADVNGDGKTDLVMPDENYDSVSVFMGNGDGTFEDETDFNTGAGTAPYGVAVADVNNDGKPDLVTANSGTNNVSVLLGDGDGTFGSPATFAAGTTPESVIAVDLNGDGNLDLAVANSVSNNVSVLLGSGSGTFAPPANFAVGAAPVDLIAADLNGKPDLVTANAHSGGISILLNTGNLQAAMLYNLTNIATGASPLSVAAGDFNGDGKPDLVAANNGSNTVSFLPNNADQFGLDTREPTASIIDVSPDPRNAPISQISIVFDKPVTGLVPGDLRLTLNSGPNLLTGGESLTSSDGITWTLGGLSGLTAAPGAYTLTLTAGGSGVRDAVGNPLVANASGTITVCPQGDFNLDGVVSAPDIDLLYARFGDTSGRYDLNGDGVVNQTDVTYLLQTILNTSYGDANLDGKTDFVDFQVLLDHWQGKGGWASGDFTGDGSVNFLDFQKLLDYWNPGGWSFAAPAMQAASAVAANSLTVNWTYAGTSETGFKVDRATDAGFTQNFNEFTVANAGARSFGDSGLADGTTYYYRVYAYNAAKTSAASCNGVVVTPLAAPAMQAATAVTTGSLTVNWTYAGASETGFKVERATNSAFTQNFNEFTVANPSARGYADSGLADGTTYYYRVYAYNTPAGNSAASGAGATTILIAPAGAPTFGTVTASQVVVNWLYGGIQETDFLIDRSTDSGFSTYTTLDTHGTNLGYIDSSVADGTTYYYRVRAVNAVAVSANSPSSSGVATPFTAPIIQAASAIAATSLTVNWTYAGDSEAGFKIDRSTDPGFGGYTTITVADPSARSYGDSGLTDGTTYYYRVYAYSAAAGNSTTSGNSAVTVLAAPTIGACTNVASGQVQVNWTDNSASEAGYVVQRSNDGATGWTQVYSGGPGSGSMSWTDTTVWPSTAYYYRVCAWNAAYGNSAYSGNSPAATTPTNEAGKVLSDYWYGGNGTAWNGQWSYINQTSGSPTISTTIQSSQGQASFAWVSGTMSGQYLACLNAGNLVDSDQKATFTAGTSGTYYSLVARGSAADATAQYYFARAYVNSSGTALAIYKHTYSGGVGTDTLLASTSVNIRAGTSYTLRFQCITSGATTNLKADIWSATANEPTSAWTVSTTDASFQGVSGWCGLRYNLKSATAAGTQTFTTDNYQAVDASSANPTYLDTFQGDATGGSAAGWTVGAGTWSVASNSYSNRYDLSANPGGSSNLLGAYSTINSLASVGDFTFTCEAKAASSTGNYAVVFGYQNSTNYYYMNFDGTSGNTKLCKVVNGTASVIAAVSGTIIANTSAHQVKIARSGMSISVWYDGQALLTNVLDSTFLDGKIGVGAYTGLAYFDNVTVG